MRFEADETFFFVIPGHFVGLGGQLTKNSRAMFERIEARSDSTAGKIFREQAPFIIQGLALSQCSCHRGPRIVQCLSPPEREHEPSLSHTTPK